MTTASKNGKPAAAKKARAASKSNPETTRQRRPRKSIPAASFEQALELAETIVEIAGGAREARRVTLFNHLNRSPDSGPSRQAVSNSSRYGLTEGSYKADKLRLTDDGLLAVSPDASPREQARARFRLAIENEPAFKALFERFSDGKLPSQQVMRDHLVAELSIPPDEAKEAVELFIVNARFVGAIKTMSGAERILTLDHVLDEIPASSTSTKSGSPAISTIGVAAPTRSVDLTHTCFYITPIGDSDSDERKHADLLLGQIVEPAIEELGLDLQVVRADKMTQPGMISKQIMDHVYGARLVVADLSYHNPNVFYELAIRHSTKLPTVLISRTSDAIPFDIADLRVVRLDMTDLYSFVPSMEGWRAELTQHARQALENPGAAITPVTVAS